MKDRPPGWDLNPSAWQARAPVLACAAAGALLSLPLGSNRGDPPQELLIETTFILALLLVVIGGKARWMTHPWLVMIFGVVVGPMGFLIATSTVVHMASWDELNYRAGIRALIALLPIGAAMREVLASLQHVRRESQRGRSGVRAFFGLSPRPRKREPIRTI